MAAISQCLREADSLRPVSDSARLDVEVLLCHVLEKDRSYLFTWPEKELDSEQQRQFDTLLARRQAGEPVAYLTGTREFWSLDLEVDESTLIPRPDTECLVETVLALLPEKKQRLADLGTGTGAIALALAYERPAWSLLAVDFNPKAVALAEKNCRALSLSNVEVRESNWFAAVPEHDFDAILSNPPYIDETDPHLQEGDVRFEPASALVAAEAGLADIRHIANTAREKLRCGGYLVVEHGYRQAEAVQAVFAECHYKAIKTYPDLAGQPRLTVGVYAHNE